MDDLIKPVKTVKKIQSNIEKFESLSLRNQPPNPGPAQPKRSLLEIATPPPEESVLKASNLRPVIQRASDRNLNNLQTTQTKHKYHDSQIFIQQSYLREPASSLLSDNAREILRNQPNHEDLVAVLQYLQFGIDGRHDFNIREMSPQATQIINVLVSVTIPDVWANTKQEELSEDEARIKYTIVSSLSSAAGIGALLAQIQRSSASHTGRDVLNDSLMVLSDILRGTKTIYDLLLDAQKLHKNESGRRLFWQDITTLIAGSRVLSIAAKALSGQNSKEHHFWQYEWLGNGSEYSVWLAKNIVHATTKLSTSEGEAWNFLSQLVRRGMSLGHQAAFVAEIYTKLLLSNHALWTPIHLILKHLAPHEQKNFFDSILSDLAQKYLTSTGGPAIAYSNNPAEQKIVAGAAALIAGVIKNNEVLDQHIETWLMARSGGSKVIELPSKRALIAALGRSEARLQRVLEQSLAIFKDKVQIQHSPIMQQEAITQTILLLVGKISRIDVKILKQPSISTLVMHSVSNRLAASVPRARLLGMIVGTAISRIVDKTGSEIDFGIEEMESEDVTRWLDLVVLDDYVGDVVDLERSSTASTRSVAAPAKHKLFLKPIKRTKPSVTTKVIAIEELSQTSESEDEDLIPYQKPDSDPEDSDEDPTLVNRSKPSAPVYITDLIKQLQMTEKPDVLSLALKSGPALIRRKAGFGTEVSDNVQTLVTILVNLQEGMSEPDLQQLRLECTIACIVASPDTIGPSLADVYFQGDFSLQQRLTILTTIGLGARELAGFGDEQRTLSTDNFPSKRLPAHLEPYSQPQTIAVHNPVAMLTNQEAETTVRPMALAAADKMTGPSALKIRTFSSRMDVERKKKEKAATRTKIIPKNLHKLLTEAVYIPLCSRMGILLSHTIGGRLPNTTILHNSTLRLFLQTLTLVIHTLGPTASLHLSILSHETLLLLLNLHTATQLSTDPAILPALLHLLLALIDVTIEAGVTAQERLITDHGAQVVELVNWSNSLSDKISVPDVESADGGISWTVLAAAIQVKWFEIGRRFQGRMLGLSIDEMEQLSSA